jgi:hypothetical protein
VFSTYLGEPIPYDPNVTPEALAQRVNNPIVFLEEKDHPLNISG